MFDVRVLDNLAAEAEQAEKRLAPGGEMRQAVEHRLKQAAIEERFGHRYQNQTGHLEQSTAASVVSEDDDGIEIHLEMGEEYATYVIDRGFSDFEQLASEAFQDIGTIIYGTGDD